MREEKCLLWNDFTTFPPQVYVIPHHTSIPQARGITHFDRTQRNHSLLKVCIKQRCNTESISIWNSEEYVKHSHKPFLFHFTLHTDIYYMNIMTVTWYIRNSKIKNSEIACNNLNPSIHFGATFWSKNSSLNFRIWCPQPTWFHKIISWIT